jgi:cyclopropane-fatty-acyl-phospholipid synthase
MGTNATSDVLEIGCGWASLATYAAEKNKCAHWTGVSISKEQIAFGQQRVHASNFDQKIVLSLMDYR